MRGKSPKCDAEFNVYKNDARGRNPATDFAIVVCNVCIYYILISIWWYILYLGMAIGCVLVLQSVCSAQPVRIVVVELV